MLREFDREDWLEWLGISRDEVPQALIIMGILDYRLAVSQWERALSDVQPTALPNAIVGSYQGMRLAFAAAYGAAMAADATHAFCGAGARVVILTGSYGALQPGTSMGDVLLPTRVHPTDSISTVYVGEGAVPEASSPVVSWLKERCDKDELPHHVGPMVSGPAIFSATNEHYAAWHEQGFLGVDMEAAPVFAVATRFGAQRAGLLVRLDSPIEGHDIRTRWAGDERQLLWSRPLQVASIALEAVL